MSKIIPFREEIFHQINQIFLESQKAFIFLWGKSGSGKSVLLQRLAKNIMLILLMKILKIRVS